MTDTPDDFFAELDAEIAEITAASRLKADAVALKRKSQNMRLSPQARVAAAAEFKSIQAIVEANMWQATCVAALFTEQHCDGCDSVHRTFLQFMQKEVLIRRPTTSRWSRIPVPNGDLPRESIVQPLKTHMCADCCTDHGFDPFLPSIKLMPIEASLTVSPSYIQGDINNIMSEGEENVSSQED